MYFLFKNMKIFSTVIEQFDLTVINGYNNKLKLSMKISSN